MSEIKTIYLHGSLAKKYGAEPIQLDANTPWMVISGLSSMFGPEFKNLIRDGNWEFMCGKDETNAKFITDELTVQSPIAQNEIHITPALEGSGDVLRIVAGAVLIVVGVYFQQGWLINIGAGLVIGGVVGLLTPTPSIDNLSNERPENKPSFLFNGAVNVYEQGGAVPLVYGRLKTGTTVVSAGYSAEEIDAFLNSNPFFDGVNNNNWNIYGGFA